MFDNLKAPWELYADEETHYVYVRCLVEAAAYEVARVTQLKGMPKLSEFVHTVIFLGEYAETDLEEALSGFGYASLDEFVSDTTQNPEGLVYLEDGSIDRDKSSGWSVDYMFVASLIAELVGGRTVPTEQAKALVSKLVGELPLE